MDNSLTGLAWVSSRHGRPTPTADLLRGLGRADIELSHPASRLGQEAQWLLLRERVRSLETRMAAKPDGA